MSVPGAATAAPHVDMRIAARELTHARSQIDGITVFQMPDLAKRDLVLGAGVGPQATQPLDPVAGFGRWLELKRMRIETVEIGLSVAGFGVDRFNGLFQAQTGFEPVIAVEC